ncbi:hypothetical protein DRO54_07015 [Candidatus Bathyarchaeota archaeon]|nr:MAG: hypothetical protein DRO54_07015 [Candidatus Bathyarchaeota archaeon]
MEYTKIEVVGYLYVGQEGWGLKKDKTDDMWVYFNRDELLESVLTKFKGRKVRILVEVVEGGDEVAEK